MSAASERPQGLLVVYTDPGPDFPLEGFNAWNDAEYERCIALDEVHTGIRYKAIDGLHPAWLALYETASPDLPPSDAPPPPDLPTFSRSTYTLLSTHTHPHTRPTDLPAAFIYLSGVEIAPAAEAAFDTWYAGEHADLFAKVPGWLRMRRYRLHAHEELSRLHGSKELGAYHGNKESGVEQAPPRHLAIHEFTNAEFADTPEFVALTETARVAEMKKSFLGLEFRVFELQRSGDDI
ncbi:hypothetical protein DFH07DRAFT_798074 [Mycena maculata]|uniref:EthD domain-containing protein n=1 Tax=Mycena maculata TaxID=230809 RepID=A0AAD7K2C6_9AGAR|nr:hypothetical protein DFH07DRAFT_798074 [Mycena maculata]